ncbi:putative olfactory receptor 13C6 [Latimeria chalumnae]|uniref:putative olfactory receptor 13C6 n=1 Tax=Latimeria chalumnae TaxID=7897 RepID=UPI00313CFC6F
MEYNDSIITFTLEGFGKASRLHYLYAVCIVLLYLLMVSANLLLIAVIVLKKCLHEPMYIFICNLSINALYGSTSVLPKLIVDLISERKTISRNGCYIQQFFIHSFTGHEVTILTVMAYDRYIAIFNPLRYADIMTKAKICILLIAAWLYSVCILLLSTGLTIKLPLCSSAIQRFYCDNMSLLKLSCVDASINKIVGITMHRVDESTIPYPVVVIMSLEFIVVPPLFNPIIYGIRTEKIRNEIIKLFRKRISPS